jgi:adenylate cyclase class IV
MEYELKFKIDRRKDIFPKIVRLGAKDLGKRKEIDLYIGAMGQSLRLRKFG